MGMLGCIIILCCNWFTLLVIRLFSCGTRKGESHLVEWDDRQGIVKRSYSGLGMRSPNVVKFATAKNKLLAAGDQHQIKFWDMDNVNILYTTKADGGLRV